MKRRKMILSTAYAATQFRPDPSPKLKVNTENILKPDCIVDSEGIKHKARDSGAAEQTSGSPEGFLGFGCSF